MNHDLRFLLSHYPAAYEVDRTPGANPIRQQLDNLNEAGSLYGAIIYQKAPIVMRHLEALLGEESFRDGLREYLNAHKFGNATWTDLIEVLDRARRPTCGRGAACGSSSPGRPTITTELEVADGRIARLAFEQSDPMKRGVVWPQQLRVVLGDADGRADARRAARRRARRGERSRRQARPAFVLPNGEGWAYGGFVLDPASLGYLTRSLPDIADPLTRGSAWVTLWDACSTARVPPAAFMDLATAALPKETDEQMTSRVLSYAGNAWWRFLPAAERTARAAAFEKVLRDGLDRAGHGQPEGRVVRRAAQRVAHDADRWRGCGRCGPRPRPCRACRWRKPTTRRSRSSWRSAKWTAGRRFSRSS